MIDLKLAKNMTGGIVRSKCSRIHIFTTTAALVYEVLRECPAINNPTDRQCKLIAYAAMGAIIEHTRMRATYYSVMACLPTWAAKKQAKIYCTAR